MWQTQNSAWQGVNTQEMLTIIVILTVTTTKFCVENRFSAFIAINVVLTS